MAETHAKAGGILTRVRPGAEQAPAPAEGLDELTRDEDVADRARLAQPAAEPVLADRPGRRRRRRRSCKGKTAVILDGEDDFVNMLRHVLARAGHDQRRRPARGLRAGAPSTATTWSIVGPGPGRPARRRPPQDRGVPARAVDELLEPRQPFLAVCLGHQVLCGRLGLDARLQGHRVPGHPVAGRARRARRRTSASTTPSSRRVADGELPDGRHGRGRPGDRRRAPGARARTSAASSSTPSRSSPSTATTCSTSWCSTCSADTPGKTGTPLLLQRQGCAGLPGGPW